MFNKELINQKCNLTKELLNKKNEQKRLHKEEMYNKFLKIVYSK